MLARAVSCLGPVCFTSRGVHVTFDALTWPGLWFVLTLAVALMVGQIARAGGMARVLPMSWLDSLAVGIGMCGRAEMAFVLSALGLTLGILDAQVFSMLIFAAFLLNLVTPLGLFAIAGRIRREHAHGRKKTATPERERRRRAAKST